MESKRTPSSEWDCKNVEDPNEVYSFDDAVEKTGKNMQILTNKI